MKIDARVFTFLDFILPNIYMYAPIWEKKKSTGGFGWFCGIMIEAREKQKCRISVSNNVSDSGFHNTCNATSLS